MLLMLAGILVAYSIGSLPTSFIFAKIMKGVDIRNYGSGNVGATNLMRMVGKLPAILALLLDVAKGALAVILVPLMVSGVEFRFDFEIYRYILGLATISGHIWPLLLKFKGGKGVATTLGVLLVVAPKIILIAFAIWLITTLITKYVSLGSVIGSISLPVSAALMAEPIEMVIFCAIICIIACYKHRSNISRLLRGEESRIGQKLKVK